MDADHNDRNLAEKDLWNGDTSAKNKQALEIIQKQSVPCVTSYYQLNGDNVNKLNTSEIGTNIQINQTSNRKKTSKIEIWNIHFPPK